MDNTIVIIIIFILILIFGLKRLKVVEEGFRNKYNVYLISNNSNISNTKINEINNKYSPGINDIVVRFNTNSNKNIFNNRTDLIIFRENKNNYLGLTDYLFDIHKYDKTPNCILLGLPSEKISSIAALIVLPVYKTSSIRIIFFLLISNNIFEGPTFGVPKLVLKSSL